MDEAKYILDANVFIEAARGYYAFDVVPGFWDGIIDYAQKGQILSIDRVKDELNRGQDVLSAWVNNHLSEAFKSTDNNLVIDQYKEIMKWVNGHEQFLAEAKAEFASGADGWLVSYAIVNNCVAVTQEAYNSERKNKVPIPNICDVFGTRYINTFSMLRELGFKFKY